MSYSCLVIYCLLKQNETEKMKGKEKQTSQKIILLHFAGVEDF